MTNSGRRILIQITFDVMNVPKPLLSTSALKHRGVTIDHGRFWPTFWPNRVWPIMGLVFVIGFCVCCVLCVCVFCCVLLCLLLLMFPFFLSTCLALVEVPSPPPDRSSPRTAPLPDRPSTQNFALFFRSHVCSFCLSLGVFSLNFVFEALGTSKVHVWSSQAVV